jgi:pSer/pThr/pTyr-binding forkhead associated (FHA) protein
VTLLQVTEDVLQTISRNHCKIVKGTPGVYLEDYSSNGTFVNGENIGKGRKRILSNGDEISLVSPQFRGMWVS